LFKLGINQDECYFLDAKKSDIPNSMKPIKKAKTLLKLQINSITEI